MTLPIGTKIPLYAEGNATENDVLEGKTFSTDKGNNLVGKIKKHEMTTITPSLEMQELGKGYYSGIKINQIDTNVLQSNFPNLKPENIVEDVDIGGIVGNIKKTKIFSGKISREYWEEKDQHEEKINYEDNKLIFNIGCKPKFVSFFGLKTYILGGNVNNRYEYGFIKSINNTFTDINFSKRYDENSYSETERTFSVNFTATGFELECNNKDRKIDGLKNSYWFILA